MQTHKIAIAPTNQLPVCLSAHHHCVSVQVIQALFIPPLCVAAYSSAPLLGFDPCFAQVKRAVQALHQGRVELLFLCFAFLARSPSSVCRHV